MREEERRLHVSGDLTQVAIVPGRYDASEEGRRCGPGAVPADTEPVTIGRLDAEPSMETLVDEGVVGLMEQLLERDRGTRVSEPAAHRVKLPW